MSSSLDPALVSIDASGDHRRYSFQIALLGVGQRCSIHWALQVKIVKPPHSAQHTVNVVASSSPAPDSLDEARNEALRQWLENDPTEHLLLWPSEQYLVWDAIKQLCEAHDEAAQVGQCHWLSRAVVQRTSRPWFSEGRWQGEELVARAYLRGQAPVVRGLEIPSDSAMPPVVAPEDLGLTTGGPTPSMVLGIPSLGFTSLLWAGHFRHLELPFASRTAAAVVVGQTVAAARQMIVDALLAAGDKAPPFLCFLGDDMLPPPEGLRQITHEALARNLSAVGGLYFARAEPPAQAFLWRHGQPGLLIPGKDFTMGNLVEVDGMGLDFCVIRTDEIRKMPRPHFQTLETEEQWSTEDSFFWNRLHDATGKKPVVDSACRVWHYDIGKGKVF